MKFLWPEMLWLLLMVPALVAAYFFLLRRKKEDALRYASLSMVKEAMGAGQRFRRHIPPLLFLVALIAMIVAIARPAAVVTLPSQHQTIILAMDVSGSMRATDVEPNRISAAQAAASTGRQAVFFLSPPGIRPLRPGLACCQGDSLGGLGGSCVQGAGGWIKRKGNLVFAQVPWSGIAAPD